MSEHAQYCPVCGRWIEPENTDEVLNGEHEGFIFVHDDIEHSDDDLDALSSGIQ